MSKKGPHLVMELYISIPLTTLFFLLLKPEYIKSMYSHNRNCMLNSPLWLCYFTTHTNSSKSTHRALLKSEIREFVAWRAKASALRVRSSDSFLRGHMRYISTAVHVLDNQAVFTTVSNTE